GERGGAERVEIDPIGHHAHTERVEDPPRSGIGGIGVRAPDHGGPAEAAAEQGGGGRRGPTPGTRGGGGPAGAPAEHGGRGGERVGRHDRYGRRSRRRRRPARARRHHRGAR